MAGKVGCALLLAVLFAAAAVSRTSFAVFLASLAVLLVGFLAWYVRTLRRDVTVTLQLPARPVHPDEDFAVLVKLHNNGRRPMPELRVVLQAVDAESGTVFCLCNNLCISLWQALILLLFYTFCHNTFLVSLVPRILP